MNPSEWHQMKLLAGAIIILGVYTWLFAFGGRDSTSKGWRRILGGFVIGCGFILLAMGAGVESKWMLWGIILYPGALSMGYGGTTLGEKVRRRNLWGLAVSSVSLVYLLPLGLWHIGLFQIGLGVTVSIVFGALWNPMSAVAEEAFIGLMQVVCIPFALIQ